VQLQELQNLEGERARKDSAQEGGGGNIRNRPTGCTLTRLFFSGRGFKKFNYLEETEMEPGESSDGYRIWEGEPRVFNQDLKKGINGGNPSSAEGKRGRRPYRGNLHVPLSKSKRGPSFTSSRQLQPRAPPRPWGLVWRPALAGKQRGRDLGEGYLQELTGGHEKRSIKNHFRGEICKEGRGSHALLGACTTGRGKSGQPGALRGTAN